MLKRFRNIFLLITIPLISLVLLATLLGFIFENKIKQKIITGINELVTVPVRVNGGISLSLLRHFPYGSVTFKEVSIDDKLDFGNKKLLRVEEFSFLFNIFSLFGDEIEVSKILIQNGELNLLKSESGKTNFDILKKESGESKEKFSVSLKKAEIKNVRLTFIDKTQSCDLDLKLTTVFLNGNFKEQNFELTSKCKICVNKMTLTGNDFFTGKNLTAEVTLDVDKAKQKYNFKNGKIKVDESEFNITGSFASLKGGTQLNFKLQNNGKSVQKLLTLLPEKYKGSLADADGNGEYTIEAEVKGILGKSSFPNVSVNAELKNAELRVGKYNKLLKKLNATVVYAMDETGESKIAISNFNCTLNDLPFNFKLYLTRLSDPYFDFYAKGVLHLSELKPFIPDSVLQDLEGTISFNNFHLKGRKTDFADAGNSTLEGSGEFKLSEVEFRANGITYGNMNGLLKYDNRVIHAQNFTLNFLGTDFSFSGSIENLFPFVHNLSAKRSSGGITLGISGSVHTQVFNLTVMLDAYDKKNRSLTAQKGKINLREIFNMDGGLQLQTGKMLLRKMEFDDITSDITLSPGRISINRVTSKTMRGELSSSGNVYFNADTSLRIKLNLNVAGLDLPQIFRDCENFGQSTLTDRHLKGTMTAAISLDATWKSYRVLDKNSLSALIDFNIKNGELIKFEPLSAASKFIRVEELADIRFSDLSNTIKIANNRIDVPEFEVKTSALNLMLFGYHYFDNTVDYHFKINLHKLLAQKFNRNTNSQQYIETDPYDGLNLFLTMTGNLSDPLIKYDHASTRKKIQNDFKQEKMNLKNLIMNIPKPVNETEQKREEKHFEINPQPKFMDFDTTDR